MGVVRSTYTTLKKLWTHSANENMDLVGAGVAFYAILALFPGLAALVSIYGLIADPQQIHAQLSAVADVLPQAAWQVIQEQLLSVVEAAPSALGFGVVFGLLFTIWSATRGMRALINAMNIIHDVQEDRGIIKMNLVAYGLTALMTLVAALAIAVIVVVPIVAGFVGVGGVGRWLAPILPWPILFVAVIGALLIIYRIAPAHNRPDLGRALKCAVGVALVWLTASLLFTFYIGNFGNMNTTYGSITAVIILMLWFFLSVRIVLFGAVWNALPLREQHRRRQEEARRIKRI